MEPTAPYTRDTPHHYFDYAMWQAQVAAGDSQRSYADWVEANLEETRHELSRAETEFEGAGGRGIELAEEIDELRARLDEQDSPEQDALLNHEGRSLGWAGDGGGMRFFL